MWAQIINAMLGIWLMVAPCILGYTGSARTNSYIFGPLAAGSAIIAIWEATRPVRWVNLIIGLWLLIAPWVLKYEFNAILNSSITALLLISFALVRGRLKHRFGNGWSYLLRSNPSNEQ